MNVGCSVYTKQIGNQYTYHHSTNYFPTTKVIPVSIKVDHDNIRVKIVAQPFSPTSLPNDQSVFDNNDDWDSLEEDLDAAVLDDTIFLDKYYIPSDNCEALVAGIVAGMACIVSNRSFETDLSVGPAGTLAVVLAPSITCATDIFAK